MLLSPDGEGRGGTPFSPGWGEVPHPVLDGGAGTPSPGPQMGYPPSRPEMGYPHLDLEWGTPIQTWDGVPPAWTWDGVWHTPSCMGYPHTWTWDGVPLPAGWGTFLPGPGIGYLPPCQLDGVRPPPRNVNRQTPVKTVLSLVLRIRMENM